MYLTDMLVTVVPSWPTMISFWSGSYPTYPVDSFDEWSEFEKEYPRTTRATSTTSRGTQLEVWMRAAIHYFLIKHDIQTVNEELTTTRPTWMQVTVTCPCKWDIRFEIRDLFVCKSSSNIIANSWGRDNLWYPIGNQKDGWERVIQRQEHFRAGLWTDGRLSSCMHTWYKYYAERFSWAITLFRLLNCLIFAMFTSRMSNKPQFWF